jgi:Uma2 family endonuclease
VRRERLRSLRREEKEKFLPLCSDFVAEILSPSDRLAALQKKMQEYIENGAQLGWLLDPQSRRVHVYRPGSEVEQLEGAESIPIRYCRALCSICERSGSSGSEIEKLRN